jgi:hypothetical protein
MSDTSNIPSINVTWEHVRGRGVLARSTIAHAGGRSEYTAWGHNAEGALTNLALYLTELLEVGDEIRRELRRELQAPSLAELLAEDAVIELRRKST